MWSAALATSMAIFIMAVVYFRALIFNCDVRDYLRIE